MYGGGLWAQRSTVAELKTHDKNQAQKPHAQAPKPHPRLDLQLEICTHSARPSPPNKTPAHQTHNPSLGAPPHEHGHGSWLMAPRMGSRHPHVARRQVPQLRDRRKLQLLAAHAAAAARGDQGQQGEQGGSDRVDVAHGRLRSGGSRRNATSCRAVRDQPVTPAVSSVRRM